MDIRTKLILWLLSLAVVLGALYGLYRYGRHVEGLERDSQQLAAVQRAVKEANRLAAVDLTAALAAAKLDADRAVASAKRSTRTEQGIAAHPEYADCALSADDLANLTAAVEGK